MKFQYVNRMIEKEIDQIEKVLAKVSLIKSLSRGTKLWRREREKALFQLKEAHKILNEEPCAGHTEQSEV